MIIEYFYLYKPNASVCRTFWSVCILWLYLAVSSLFLHIQNLLYTVALPNKPLPLCLLFADVALRVYSSRSIINTIKRALSVLCANLIEPSGKQWTIAGGCLQLPHAAASRAYFVPIQTQQFVTECRSTFTLCQPSQDGSWVVIRTPSLFGGSAPQQHKVVLVGQGAPLRALEDLLQMVLVVCRHFAQID